MPNQPRMSAWPSHICCCRFNSLQHNCGFRPRGAPNRVKTLSHLSQESPHQSRNYARRLASPHSWRLRLDTWLRVSWQRRSGIFHNMEPQPEHEASSVSLSAYARLLRQNRNFRRLWMAQIVSEIGDWFYSLAIYSLLLQLTGRASSVALALVLQVLPQTFVGPAAGVVNDRVRRKHVMITADLVRMAVVLAMLLVRSRSTVWLVYPLLLLETIMAAFFEPARNSVIPNITAREDVIVANTLASSTWSVNLMIGAALGGVVAAFLGRDAVFVLNAISFLLSALLIRGMRFEEPHAEGGHALQARDLLDFSPIVEGVRYVRRDARLFATILVKAGLLVIGPSWVLFTADLGLSMFTIAIGAYLAGAFLDWGVSARIVSAAAGASMLLPAAAWAWALRLWKREIIAMRPEPADRT